MGGGEEKTITNTDLLILAARPLQRPKTPRHNKQTSRPHRQPSRTRAPAMYCAIRSSTACCRSILCSRPSTMVRTHHQWKSKCLCKALLMPKMSFGYLVVAVPRFFFCIPLSSSQPGKTGEYSSHISHATEIWPPSSDNGTPPLRLSRNTPATSARSSTLSRP